MGRVTGKRAGGSSARWLRGLAAVCWLVVGTAASPAQTTVEKKIAALKARIAQMEHELATSKSASQPQGAEVMGVSATEGSSARPFIRPAVLLSSSPGSGAAAAVSPVPVQAAPSTLESRMADVEKSVSEMKGKADFDGLSFFKGVRFSGFLDAYYTFDFNEPADGKVNYRNFDFNHNSLTLNQVSFDMSRPVSESAPLGYMLQLDFGPTADWVNGPDPVGGTSSTSAHFLQYYLSGRVPVGRGLTLDVGKFVTQHGAEVIDTRGDWNYSRGLLFAWAIPYYHFGLRATYPVSDKVTLGAYLVNGWNNVLDNNGAKTGGFQLVWNPTSRFSFIQNYMLGPEQTGNSDDIRHLWDSLLIVKLHDKVTFMTNFDYGRDRVAGSPVHWIGTANYLKLQLTPTFSLTPRFEFFSDPMGFSTGTRQQLKEFTITPEFLFNEHLVTRFEFRRDWSNQPTFTTGEAGKDPQIQNTAAVGMILKF